MMLRRFSHLSAPVARASAGLGLLALLGLGIASANTEAVVTGRFTAALEAAPQQAVADATPSRGQALVSGSEAYWLAGKRRQDAMAGGTLEPAAWGSEPLAAVFSVGDRITIANGKSQRVLEVVAVSETGSADGAAAATDAHNVVVTFRDTSSPEGHLVTLSVPEAQTRHGTKPARAL